jgi:hypothetical protein
MGGGDFLTRGQIERSVLLNPLERIRDLIKADGSRLERRPRPRLAAPRGTSAATLRDDRIGHGGSNV